MTKQQAVNEYDAIIVGSGTCGAVIARELSKQGKKVLILERGRNRPLSESFFNVLSISDTISLGDKLMIMRALTTGGSTALYFGVADLPPLDVFRKLGIDLSGAFNELRQELPLGELPDEFISPQALQLRAGALQSGCRWKKKLMLIDQSRLGSGYSYEAKWKARSFIQEAIGQGAVLVNRATVGKVLVENNTAIGVEYKRPYRSPSKVYGSKIILAAGSAASPLILRDSGIRHIEKHGFFIDPSCALFGKIKGLNAKDGYMGSMGMDYEDDIMIGDLNATRGFYKMLMLANAKPERLFAYSDTIAIGVKVKDRPGGEIREKNRFYKQLTDADRQKLKLGQQKALGILKNAGATDIFQSPYGATDLGGTLEIGRHLDKQLETSYRNLYVCDGSVIPPDVRISPALTLLCLGKYLARNLFPVQTGNGLPRAATGS